MIRGLVLLIAVLAHPVAAETARVISGEHGDFTRLVVELPSAGDWTVGRTAMGYGFTTRAERQPGYDLTGVWDRIPRSRLQALRVDPATGALLLGLACDCHVFPFEVRPGTVVLDIREGTAPPGSVFEAALASGQTGARSPVAPEAPTYDWLGLPRRLTDPVSADLFRMPVGGAAPVLDPLRDELLLQLSRGAADGVVDMVLPGKPLTPEVQGMGDLSGAIIRIGTLPGLEVQGALAATSAGEDRCIPDAALDLNAWGEGRPPLDLLAEARTGLYEEFDVPSPEAILRAVRLHLYLGFGAEARQYGALMPEANRDRAMAAMLSLARLVDGEADPTSPFASMAGCDGAAALWAVLAQSSLPAGTKARTDAVVRSFQSLPAHLRRHLGPALSSRLLQTDAEAARMIRDAYGRTPDIPAGTVALLDAQAELEAARPEAALGHAQSAVRANGSGLEGLVALVEAHFQSGKPLSPDVADSLLALRDLSTADFARRDRSVILALALSGQEDQAFILAGPDHPVIADLWEVLAAQADDDALLSHAVRPSNAPMPKVRDDVGLAIAERLSGLGFHEAALPWLGPVRTEDSADKRLVAARAQLALGGARAALQLLTGLSGTEAQGLQADAYRQLGALGAARQASAAAGNAEDSLRFASWAGDWAVLRDDGKDVWADASALVQPVAPATDGPLAAGRAALEDSAAARTAIGALLREVPTPP